MILIVKSIFHLSRLCAVSAAVALVSLLGACGQKGPLFLPKPEPVAPAKPAQATPAPAEKPSPASK